MPELPEVETVARQLKPCLIGRTVQNIRVLDSKLPVIAPASVRGTRIEDVCRAGKQIVIRLIRPSEQNGAAWLCVHLRMTGRLLCTESNAFSEHPHLRVWLGLDRGALCFADVRRFGTFRFCTSWDEIRPTGIDPLSRQCSAALLRDLLAKSRQPLKPWLLRQDRLTGLGNIYASEILFTARLHPARLTNELSADEVARLHRGLRRVLRAAIHHCGTTFSNFQDAHGLTGSYQRYLKVYAREGEPCPRCRAPVERIVQQQRSTFFCPRCQH